jgi:uncharacterized protein
MKKTAVITSLCMLFAYWATAQNADYRVIFDITSKDSLDHKTLIRQVRGISQSRSDAQLEVAIYGDALNMVLKDKSTVADAIQEITAGKKAGFKVCAATMKRLNIDKSQLLPGVEVVPDAIFQIITRQHEGWGYIKVAH